MNQTDVRHTITLGHETFQRLRRKGTFGESYTELVSRLLDQLERRRDIEGELKFA